MSEVSRVREPGAARSTILFGLLGVMALILGLPMLQGEAAGAERGEDPAPLLAASDAPSEAGGDPLDAVAPSGGEETAPVEAVARVEGERARTGVLEGMVKIPEAADLETFAILVEEAVNEEAGDGEPRWKRGIYSFPIESGAAMARFRVPDLPFSPYGWKVQVLAGDYNGSSQLVSLDAEHPKARVLLELRPPVPVSLVIKDQERMPIAELPILLRPKGSPRGRASLRGATDLLGHCLFQKVRSGAYELILGDPSAPAVPPRTLSIPDRGEPFFPIEVPRGASIGFRITNPGGVPLEGVEVQAIARDSRVYRKYVLRSDRLGRARFAHLKEGRYFVHFTKKGFDRGFQEVTVGKDGRKEVPIILRWR